MRTFLLLSCLLLPAAVVLGAECWDVVHQTLLAPTALQCSAIIGIHAETVGGITTCCPDNATAVSTNLVARVNLESRYGWYVEQVSGPTGISLPKLRGHATCATHLNDVMLTPAAQDSHSRAPATSQVFWLSSGEYKPAPPLLMRRARASLAESNGAFFIFGGVDEYGNPARTIEMLPAGGNAWVEFPQVVPVEVCDCTSASHRDLLLFICRNCSAPIDSPRTDDQGIVFAIFPKSSTVAEMPFWHRNESVSLVSITATTIAQYVAVMTFYNDSNWPIVRYFDVWDKTWYVVTTDWLIQPRIHGTIFVSKAYLFYVGGQAYGEPEHPKIEPRLLSAVDKVPVVKTENADLYKRSNRTYDLGETVIVRCQRGVTIRLATDVRCYYAADGIPDAPCNETLPGEDGTFAFLEPTKTAQAYLCLSLGTCFPGKMGEPRVACLSSSGDALTNFRQCNREGGCCWDANRTECYQYFLPTTQYQYDNLYFINSDLNPVSISRGSGGETASDQSAFSKFASSTKGIIIFSMVGAVFVLLLVVVIMRLRLARARVLSTSFAHTNSFQSPTNVIEAKYIVVKELGRGGFGRVFLVKRKTDGVELAMKYIPCSTDEDRGFAMKEFEVIRKAQGHTNMVTIYDVFMNWMADEDLTKGLTLNTSSEPSSTASSASETKRKRSARSAKDKSSEKAASPLEPLIDMEPRFLCIVMTYAPEGDLARHIVATNNRGDSLSEDWLLKVLALQLCDVLAYLHSREPSPIVHRDLKPENVLLANNQSKILITDFGLAQQSDQTYMSTRAGSLHYVAPECWKRHYTETVDMWGVGCILYAAATGRCTANTARVMFNDARERGFQREIRSDLSRFSADFTQFILSLLNTDPSKRLTAKSAMQVVESMIRKRGNKSGEASASPTRTALDVDERPPLPKKEAAPAVQKKPAKKSGNGEGLADPLAP